MDNTNELWMTKYIIGEIFSSGGATLYKNPSDQTVSNALEDYIAARFFMEHIKIAWLYTSPIF